MRTTYTKEAHVKDDVKVILTKHGWFWFMPPANAYGKSGISDFVAIRGPEQTIVMFIETKFGSNKPTPMQVGFLNSVRAEGAFAFVVNDRNIAWLAAFMESFDIEALAAAKGEKMSEEHGSRMLNAIYELSNKLLDTVTPTDTPAEVDPAVQTTH